MTEPGPITQEPKASRWEDFLEIFYAPSRVFARRGGSDWGIPLLVLVVVTGILVYGTFELVRPLLEADSARNFAAQASKMTPEQMERAQAAMKGMTRFIPIFIIVMTAVLPLLFGLFLWLVGKTVSAVETLGEAMMISVFAYFPRILGWVVVSIQAAMLPEGKLNGMAAVSIGPARFLDPATTSAGMLALAARLDLFVLWTTVLFAIGLRVKGKITPMQATIAGIVLWLIGTIPVFGQLARGQ